MNTAPYSYLLKITFLFLALNGCLAQVAIQSGNNHRIENSSSVSDIPVLCYHLNFRKSKSGGGLNITPEILDQQFKILKDEGFETITLDDFYSAMIGNPPVNLPRRPILITFDDGPIMSRLSREEIRSQFFLSQKKLKKKVGMEIKDLAYPFGAYNQKVIDELKKTGCRMAFTANYGINRTGDNLFTLKRYLVLKEHSLTDFRNKLNQTN